MTDKEIQQAVLRELDYEPQVRSTEIGVAVKDGIITLSGSVAANVPIRTSLVRQCARSKTASACRATRSKSRSVMVGSRWRATSTGSISAKRPQRPCGTCHG
jgi:hypothetical protein